MLKNARPSQYFIGAILRAYDKEAQRGKPVTCSSLWDHYGGWSGDVFELRAKDGDPVWGLNHLDELVADFFNAERDERGDRHIGRVRITIERVP